MNRNAKLDRLRGAMASLIPNSNFTEFMRTVQELREQAVTYAVNHQTLADERKTIAALGEIAAYDDILAVYRQHLDGAIEAAQG